jgi:hypothetical protein
MLPENRTFTGELLLKWANGDTAAAGFLFEIAQITRLADDIVDTDAERQRNVGWLLTRTLITLPTNPFYMRHAALFGPIFANTIIKWQQSDEWRQSGAVMRQNFGYVMREAIGDVYTAVAMLTGGFDHARAVAEEFFDVCHAQSSETIEDWVKGN